MCVELIAGIALCACEEAVSGLPHGVVCAHLVHLCRIKLNEDQEKLAKDFSEYLHDVWARDLLDRDWEVGEEFSKEMRTHPELVPFKHLPTTVGH